MNRDRGGTQSFLVRDDGSFEVVDDMAAGLAAARAAGGFVWTELDHPLAADLAAIQKAFGLHRLAVEHAVTARSRPKLDAYEDTRFLTLKTLRHRDATAPLDVGRVMVFVGDAFVVTVRQEDRDTLERARGALLESGSTDLTPLDVLHAVLDVAMDDFDEVSRRVEESIIAAADRLFSPGGNDEAPLLYAVTLQLLAMGHAVKPLIEPLRHLSDGAGDGMDVELAHRLRDVVDRAVVLSWEIGDYSQLVEHLRDGNDSRIALQQNTDMRKISAWAAIIAVPAAITGFFGMNVPYPGFGHVAGLAFAVVLQVVLALALFAVFRRRRWL
ncbi:MAG TPA: CorA family divalent cation transporter [Euzebyales bacterium]|nr:CorA family divalent cation transporter [Euzebyales bacterium]